MMWVWRVVDTLTVEVIGRDTGWIVWSRKGEHMKKFVCLAALLAVVSTPVLAGSFTSSDWEIWTRDHLWDTDGLANPDVSNGNLIIPIGTYNGGAMGDNYVLSRFSTSDTYNGSMLGDIAGKAVVVTYRVYSPNLPIGQAFDISDFMATGYSFDYDMLNNPPADIRMTVEILNLNNQTDTRYYAGQFFSAPISDFWFSGNTSQNLVNGDWRTIVVPLTAENFDSYQGYGSPDPNSDRYNPLVGTALQDTLGNNEYIRLDFSGGYGGRRGIAFAEGMTGQMEISDFMVIDLVPSDLNFDGVVDIEDYNIMMANWGQTFQKSLAYAKGDLNGDGVVDILDYEILLQAFPDAPPPIPEPMTMSLLTLGGLALLRRKR